MLKKAELQSNTHVLHNHHWPMVVWGCLPARANFSRKFSLTSCFELLTQTPNELHFGLILFKMTSHQFVLYCNLLKKVCFGKPFQNSQNKLRFGLILILLEVYQGLDSIDIGRCHIQPLQTCRRVRHFGTVNVSSLTVKINCIKYCIKYPKGTRMVYYF